MEISKWKLRFLDDPKGVYGEAEYVDTFANPQLSSKAPDAYAFLKKLSWSAEDVGAVMLAINDGTASAQATKDWIASNADKLEAWLQ